MRWENVVAGDQEIMGGVPVFTGTRVPVASLIDHLSAGVPLDDFLEGFPGVKRQQATAFLQIAFEAAMRAHAAPGTTYRNWP